MKKLILTALAAAIAQGAFAADITVSAAASLTDAFGDIAKAYQAKYPDAKIDLNFAGSGALLQQISKGAPVDVFASADTVENVPVGRYTKGALEKAGLWDKLGERNLPTQNVRQSLDYVARGEADAGFVYATDAAIMPDKVKIVLEVPLDKPLVYPIAVLKNSKAADESKRFVAFVTGADGQKILQGYGFSAPAAAK